MTEQLHKNCTTLAAWWRRRGNDSTWWRGAGVVTVAACLLVGFPADGAERSAKQRADFVRQHPCPATGERRGPCPGYVVDHVEPLCAGGADRPSNMQWQAVDAAKRKDSDERRRCAELRKRDGK